MIVKSSPLLGCLGTQPPLFWLPLDLEGFLCYPQLWEGWSITLGLLAPVRMLSLLWLCSLQLWKAGLRLYMGREDAPQTSALAATTGTMAKFSVSRAGGTGWQGTGTPPPQEPFCLLLLCAPPRSYTFR